MATPLSAKNAVVRVNGTTCPVKRWSCVPRGEALDVCSSESGGYGDWISGVLDLDCTIEGDWDSASSQFSYLAAGSVVSSVLLYVNSVGSAKWTLTSALVVDNEHGAEVRGLISFKATLKAKGSFSFG